MQDPTPASTLTLSKRVPTLVSTTKESRPRFHRFHPVKRVPTPFPPFPARQKSPDPVSTDPVSTKRVPTPFPPDPVSTHKGKHRTTLDRDLTAVVTLLVADPPLPKRYRDHALTGDWSDHRDCHIRPDLLLYRKPDASTLELVRLGSPSEPSL